MIARKVRFVQLAIALLLAAVLAVPVMTVVDDLAWIAVSRLMTRPVSGEIVLVSSDSGVALEPDSSARRFARALDALDKLAPEAVIIEFPFSGDDPGLAALQREVAQFSHPLVLSRRLPVGATGQLTFDQPALRAEGSNTKTAFSNMMLDGFGHAWKLPYTISADGVTRPGLATAIAGALPRSGEFFVDYRFDVNDFQIFTLDQLTDGQIPPDALTGRRVVLSSTALRRNEAVKLPGLWRVPDIYIALFGAETLLAGPRPAFAWYWSWLAVGASLGFAILLPPLARRIVYGATAAAVVSSPVIAAAAADAVVSVGAPVALLAIYFSARLRSVWRARAAGTEAVSGLFNFQRLEEDFTPGHGRLIIARVDRYEEILASLDPARHREFIRQIAQRLTIGRDVAIYTDSTGHFAWFEREESSINAHIGGLLALANAPVTVEGRSIDFACSFGILDTPMTKARAAISATTVAAETAAQRSSKMAWVSEQTSGDLQWQLGLHAALDQAIANHQIYLVYQPQCDLETDELLGAEALVRWHHPERGEIAPAAFIPQVESSGRLKPLTAHVVRLAAQAAGAMALSGVRISVNISATLIADDDFVRLVKDNVEAGRAQPSDITIEITETARIVNHPRAARNLAQLREAGFSVSLDDFGTGEANLSLLVALPCDELKIDRSFVAMVAASHRARVIVSVLAQTALGSNMRLVAEGIETEEDRRILLDLGCTVGQGFLLAKPMQTTDFLKRAAAERIRRNGKLTLS